MGHKNVGSFNPLWYHLVRTTQVSIPLLVLFLDDLDGLVPWCLKFSCLSVSCRTGLELFHYSSRIRSSGYLDYGQTSFPLSRVPPCFCCCSFVSKSFRTIYKLRSLLVLLSVLVLNEVLKLPRPTLLLRPGNKFPTLKVVSLSPRVIYLAPSPSDVLGPWMHRRVSVLVSLSDDSREWTVYSSSVL